MPWPPWHCVITSLFILLLIPTGLLRAQNPLTDHLAQRSQWVFLGKVLDQRSYLSLDGRFILTRYRFAVEHTLKGEHRQMAEVVEYGGTVGEETLYVSHTPRYRPGGEYILFAHRDSRGRLRTLDGNEGQLRVIRGPQNQGLVKLYRQQSLSSWFPAKKPGLLPLDTVLNVLSKRLEARREVR